MVWDQSARLFGFGSGAGAGNQRGAGGREGWWQVVYGKIVARMYERKGEREDEEWLWLGERMRMWLGRGRPCVERPRVRTYHHEVMT